MAKITKLERAMSQLPTRKKVVAYARISEESERLNHSLSAQISYYSNLIQKHPEWEYAGVYADSGISGTRAERRPEFTRMVADCETGRVDIILTKSISRFARNTVDLLNTVRHLKELGIEVRFEKEHINSLSGDGELMLSILASFAQEESRSISENVKWGTVQRFKKGIPNGRFGIYGYRWEGDKLVIQPEQAKIVRLIYDNFLAGLSAESTEKQLEDMGVKSYTGRHFGNTSIRQILVNITYTGNLLLQKEYIADPISGKTKKNRGELPQYFVENTHEAIIPMEVFQRVQDEIARRRELGALANWSIQTSCFTSKIKCGCCGKSYQHSSRKRQEDPNASYPIWICGTRRKTGNAECTNKDIPEPMLKRACAAVLGLDEFDEVRFSEQIERIVIPEPNEMIFHFKDGRTVPHHWESTMRKDCWTQERREATRKNRMGKNPSKKHQNPFTGYLRCPACGAFFRRQTKPYKDGTMRIYWHCPNSTRCGNTAKPPEPILKDMLTEAMGIETFDENAFHASVECIELTGTYEATIHMRNGEQIIKAWIPTPRKGYPHTEAYKAHMREVSKAMWTDERKAEMSRRMKQIRSEKKWPNP